MVFMPVIGDLLAYLVHLKHTVFCNLPDVLAAYQLESLQRILDDAVENIINLSPCRIAIPLSAEADIDSIVPGEVSFSKAYKVCYISI